MWKWPAWPPSASPQRSQRAYSRDTGPSDRGLVSGAGRAAAVLGSSGRAAASAGAGPVAGAGARAKPRELEPGWHGLATAPRVTCHVTLLSGGGPSPPAGRGGERRGFPDRCQSRTPPPGPANPPRRRKKDPVKPGPRRHDVGLAAVARSGPRALFAPTSVISNPHWTDNAWLFRIPRPSTTSGEP